MVPELAASGPARTRHRQTSAVQGLGRRSGSEIPVRSSAPRVKRRPSSPSCLHLQGSLLESAGTASTTAAPWSSKMLARRSQSPWTRRNDPSGERVLDVIIDWSVLEIRAPVPSGRLLTPRALGEACKSHESPSQSQASLQCRPESSVPPNASPKGSYGSRDIPSFCREFPSNPGLAHLGRSNESIRAATSSDLESWHATPVPRPRQQLWVTCS